MFVEADNVHAGPIVIAWPVLRAMKRHEVSFREDVLELNLLSGIFGRHFLELFDEGSLPVTNPTVVLDGNVADVAFDGLAGFALLEHQVAIGHYVFLVLLETLRQPILRESLAGSSNVFLEPQQARQLLVRSASRSNPRPLLPRGM